MKTIYWISVTLFIAGCSSSPKHGIENAGQETVISRMNDLSSRPSWVDEEQPFKISDKVTSLGSTVVSGDSNTSSVLKIADLDAIRAISSGIESKIESISQSATDGVGIDQTQLRELTASVTKLTTSSVHVTKRYYERVAVVGENGVPAIRLRAFSLAEISIQDFKLAISEAMRARQNKGGISAEFAKKADAQFDRLLNDSRTPSNESEK